MVDFPAPRTRQKIVEHERQILEQTMVGVQVMSQERTSDPMVEQCAEISVSQCGKEIVEVVQITPLEQVQPVQRRITEQIVDVPVRQVLREGVEVARLAPQKGAQRRVAEHIVAHG